MAALLPILGAAAIGGLAYGFGGKQDKASPGQLQKQDLLDELLRSIKGEGQFSDLFNMDDAGFQKSFVDPAKSMFQNQIAPQIQQSFISSGQQRGTGLDDTLTRAGVDMDQILNQQFAQMQQQAEQSKLGAINKILGTDSGVQAKGPGFGSRFLQGAAGSLTGKVGQQAGAAGGQGFDALRKGFINQQMSGITSGSRLG